MRMKNYLISEAIGDIAGSAYEGKSRRIKDYDKVKMFSSRAHFTDDTVLTFACAEALIDKLDMTMNLWKCANEHRHAGFGSKFKLWMTSHNPKPYRWHKLKKSAFVWHMKRQLLRIIIQKASKVQKQLPSLSFI